MSEAFEREQSLIDYLLGRLPDGERNEMEGRLLFEEDMHDELLATADDLIHAYLVGALSEDERRCFEGQFLASPRHRERLAFLREMFTVVDRAPVEAAGTRVSFRWRPLAAAAILAAAGLLFALSQRWQDRAPAIVTDGTPQPPAPTTTARPLEPASPGEEAPAPGETRTVVLPHPSATVDVGLTPRIGIVRVELPVKEDRPGFDAVVRSEDGKTVWRAHLAPPDEPGQSLVLTIPARVFVSALYTLRIEGESLRGASPRPLVLEYRLRVLREPHAKETQP